MGSDNESNISSRVLGYVVLGWEFDNQMLSDSLKNISSPMITHISWRSVWDILYNSYTSI